MKQKPRLAISALGSMIGKCLATIKIENVDLKYNEKIKEDAPRLVKPIKQYIVETVEITSAKMLTDAEGDIYVVFNDNSDMKFPVIEPFTEPTGDTINEAIEAATNGKRKYFADATSLYAEANALNEKNRNLANSLAAELMRNANFLKDLETSQKADLEKFKAELKG